MHFQQILNQRIDIVSFDVDIEQEIEETRSNRSWSILENPRIAFSRKALIFLSKLLFYHNKLNWYLSMEF